MSVIKYPHLFSPITLGNTVFKNRIFAAPTSYMNGDHLNLISKEMIAYFELKAFGGAACVTMGDTQVDSGIGRVTEVEFPLDDPTQRGDLASMAKAIKKHGSVASVQLSHGGMYARNAGEVNGYLWGPTGGMIPFRPGGTPDVKTDGSFIEVREMDEEMISHTISRFGDAALFAKQCGFGMVMVHGGHGWLLSQFMSPETNKRTDRWGGSVENRMRLPLAIIEDIRKKCGQQYPIEFRMSGSECCSGGYDIDEGVKLAKLLDGKVDLIHVSAGNHERMDAFFRMAPTMFDEDGCNLTFAEQVKKHVKTPVATVGAFTDPKMMEEVIASGKADIIQLGRQMLADPELPNKARAGRDEEIVPCMRCFTCFSEIAYTGHIECAVNPKIGYELETSFKSPCQGKKKKVLIAGGGIAGMQAALDCEKQGHEVILCEKSDRLGGILLCEEQVPFKKHMHEYIEKQIQKIARANIEVRLNTEANESLAKEIAPDVIIAAMGATPIKPGITGIDGENVYGAVEMYQKPEAAGENVAIIGGGLVGVELALFLAMKGKKVTIIEMQPMLSYTGAVFNGFFLDMKIPQSGVAVELLTKVTEINSNGVCCEDAEGNKKTISADTVVYAVGLKPELDKANELRDLANEFWQIGDCLAPRNILAATQEGYFAAEDLSLI